MLKCLMKYEWVKLRRDPLPAGKGIKSDARKPWRPDWYDPLFPQEKASCRLKREARK